MCCTWWIVIGLISHETHNFVLGYITEPELTDLSNGHTLVGEDITLECIVSSNKPGVLVEWEAPLNLNLTMDRTNISTSVESNSESFYNIKSIYNIRQARINDKSNYYCRVFDADNIYNAKYQYIWVPVYGPQDYIIEFNDVYSTFDKVRSEIKIGLKAHPKVTFYWIDKNNNKIDSNSSLKFTVGVKYLNGHTNYQITLKFRTIDVGDFGNYTLVVENKFDRKNMTVSVNITGSPTSILTVDNSDKNSSIIKCQTSAYPKPTINWEFEPCYTLSCFSKKSQIERFSVKKEEIYLEDHGLQIFSYTVIKNSDSGTLRSVSNNSFGNHTSIQHVFSIKNSFEIFSENIIQNGSLLTLEALYHENIEIICGVSLQDHYREIKWYRHDRSMSLDDLRIPIKGFDEYNIENIDAIYSSISKISFNIDKSDQAIYTCKATRNNGKVDSKIVRVIAKEQPTLNVASNMQNKTMEGKLKSSWKFFCNVDGYPSPRITWFKNNARLNISERIKIKDNNQTLAISYLKSEDNGTYKCEVSNRLNQMALKLATLRTIEADFDWSWIVITILIFVLIVVITFTVIKMRREYKIKKELREAGLAYFEKGAIELINPELSVEDQADLLPYDKSWEIPEENLILGKELGSGAFGVVVKGTLHDFPTEESTTTVAVKTVKKIAGYDSIKALASELKIMGHIGKHVNIVNLIGACTKNIAKRKLLVVVEYCSFGNLHEHILYNRMNFLDQRNKDRDEFDWTVGDKSETKIDGTKLQYKTIEFSKSSTTNSAYESDGTDDIQVENEEKTKHMCSKDLLTWAFQVTKGMEYLASRKVLHGDLAARNILLCDNNVIKVSDFGLSRNLYKNGIYEKKEKGPLPVKWMAVESIGENIFSTQSDVWSFGVVLWEFFSLAKTPYPGMQVDQTFYQLLFNGYRMEKPDFSTKKLYEIMLNCWNADPMTRPTFTDLSTIIGSLLEQSTVNHYMDMNTSYVQMNNQGSSQQDYISMMSPPTFQNTMPSSSNYVNNINYFRLTQEDPRYVNIVCKTDSE